MTSDTWLTEKCGTDAGYQRHLAAAGRSEMSPLDRYMTPAVSCPPCENAHLNRVVGAERRGALKPCGTAAAYRRHLRNGEDPCVACRAANTRDAGKRRARAKGEAYYESARATVVEVKAIATPAPKRVLKPCGTDAAYRRHRRHGETCYECMEAHAIEGHRRRHL